ncbi:MAG: N-acetyltransferase [Candidatus Aenigmarchaeota archaeon]|nr:N-acetyltransferase [Candidatus Aenigmarchaeota archaeon]
MIQDNVVLGNSEDGVLKIGENSIIRSGTVIYSGVEIGKKLTTGHNVLIRENTTIGDEVLIGTNATIDGDCRIGNKVKIQTGAYIPRNTIIEDGAFLGPFCVLTNDKHMEYGAKLEGPTIKKGAKIGANATILPGVVVGENAMVGAGAVVAKDVKSGDVVVGNPAKSMKGE